MLKRTAQLVDESHFLVSIRECPSCAQQFLQVFAETVDWEDGEDPQDTTRIPITAAEADALLRKLAGGGYLQTSDVAQDRRSLRRIWPKGEAPSTFWGTGLWIGLYD